MFNINSELPRPILILEDDPLVQKRVMKILKKFGYTLEDLNFVQTIKAAKQVYDHNSIALILADLGLPDGNGIDFIHFLRKERANDDVPIMVISAWRDAKTVLEALSAGANSYLLKERDDFEMIFSIRSILRGGAIIDPVIALEILKKSSLETSHEAEKTSESIIQNEECGIKLSAREIETLVLVSKGNSSREIAELLHISKFTVDVHIKKIYQKLSVNSKTKAINAAKEFGIIS